VSLLNSPGAYPIFSTAVRQFGSDNVFADGILAAFCGFEGRRCWVTVNDGSYLGGRTLSATWRLARHGSRYGKPNPDLPELHGESGHAMSHRDWPSIRW
jgi:hypothetical protein